MRYNLDHRLSFQQRVTVADEYGGTRADFYEVFVRFARVQPSLGIETVNAARLGGKQPVDIVVVRDSDTRKIAADWQATDVNDGTVYALTSPPADLQMDRLYLTVKATVGVAS